jgi:outer membrane biosynthesis protein TonB
MNITLIAKALRDLADALEDNPFDLPADAPPPAAEPEYGVAKPKPKPKPKPTTAPEPAPEPEPTVTEDELIALLVSAAKRTKRALVNEVLTEAVGTVKVKGLSDEQRVAAHAAVTRFLEGQGDD